MTTGVLTVGLIQREIVTHDPAGNLLSTIHMMEPCVAQGVNLFVLTELWATGLVDITDSQARTLPRAWTVQPSKRYGISAETIRCGYLPVR